MGPTKRLELYEKQKGICPYCGNLMDPRPARKTKSGGSYDNGYSMDHVLPKSRGGQKHGNILLAHVKCNSKKGNREPTRGELKYLGRVLNGGRPMPKRLWNGKTRFL